MSNTSTIDNNRLMNVTITGEEFDQGSKPYEADGYTVSDVVSYKGSIARIVTKAGVSTRIIKGDYRYSR